MSEGELLSRLDSVGLPKAQLAELVAMCSLCGIFMTQRSMARHRHCDGVARRGAGKGKKKANFEIMKLACYGEADTGLSEVEFLGALARCPHCLLFMTWHAAEFHDCIFEAQCLNGDFNGSSPL
jgi:hypothetical protein